MRFFVTGPKILGFRPGVIFSPRDLVAATRQPQSTTGSFAYVIANEIGHHKIGVSTNPLRRIAELQTGSSSALRFAYIGVTPSTAYAIEDGAHDLLAAHQTINEWFAVPASIAIGAVIEAAGRLGEPIQQVQPAMVPQIIRMTSEPAEARQRAPWPHLHPWWFIAAGLVATFALSFALVRSITG
jgi:hypothetical protein